jgi:dihydrodipicolinate synthase/N-acetylneuraminate lyase
MDALLEHVGGQRIDAVFVNGTTAEFPSLTRAERRACVAATVRVLGPERTIAHIGASSAYEAALLTKDAIASGAERFAAIVPYYMHSDFNAVRDYFVQIRHVISWLDL